MEEEEEEQKALLASKSIESKGAVSLNDDTADSMAGLSAALAKEESLDVSTEPSSNNQPKQRHRRVKSSSRRPWDGLFEPQESNVSGAATVTTTQESKDSGEKKSKD